MWSKGFSVLRGVVVGHGLEDAGFGQEAARIEFLQHAREHRPQPIALLLAHAVLAAEARHVGVGFCRLDLPRIDDVGPFRAQEALVDRRARLSRSGLGQQALDQVLARDLRIATVDELVKFARDADERRDA